MNKRKYTNKLHIKITPTLLTLEINTQNRNTSEDTSR